MRRCINYWAAPKQKLADSRREVVTSRFIRILAVFEYVLLIIRIKSKSLENPSSTIIAHHAVYSSANADMLASERPVEMGDRMGLET